MVSNLSLVEQKTFFGFNRLNLKCISSLPTFSCLYRFAFWLWNIRQLPHELVTFIDCCPFCISEASVVLPFEIQTFFCLWLYKLRGQGGTNSLSLVSEGCCTLFALCRNVSLPSKACLFSFVYLLLCLKYIILLLLLPEKLLCPCSLPLASRSVKIEYCI